MRESLRETPLLTRPAGWPGILAALSLFSLLWFLSLGKSLTGDEALTVALAGVPFRTMIAQVGLESHVPGFYALVWAWLRVFGNDLSILRVLPLLTALATIVLAGRRLSARMMLLLCTSPFLLHLSVELRMYGLLALCGTTLLIVLREVAASRARRPFILLAALCALSVWVHHFAWPGVAASAILLLRRRRFADCAVLLAVTALLYTPWLPMIAGQIGRFAPGSEGTASGLMDTSGPLQMLAGVPFSAAGTLLRFSAGTSVFSFDLFSLRSLGFWAFPGALLTLLFIVSAASRLRRIEAVPAVILLLMLPVCLLRPSARHFALFFPAFLLLISNGLEGSGKLRRAATGTSVALALALCVQFAGRTTLPQRCTYDRDLREAAMVAGAAAEGEDIPIAVYLDSYSTLAFLLHLRDEGYGSVETWNPHAEMFAGGWYIYPDPGEGMAFLLHDSDSLFESIASEAGGPFVLVANDPRVVGGRPFGGADRLLGRGSDTVSDEDLMQALESVGRTVPLPLASSEGPFSAFRVEPFRPGSALAP